MKPEHFAAALKQLGAKSAKDEWKLEGGSLTLYVAHGGVTLTVSRIETLRVDGELLLAKTHKGEAYSVAREDVFALAADSSPGQTSRRAGFV
jgi:hypothetical protein